jgi:hypothetical protein
MSEVGVLWFFFRVVAVVFLLVGFFGLSGVNVSLNIGIGFVLGILVVDIFLDFKDLRSSGFVWGDD